MDWNDAYIQVSDPDGVMTEVYLETDDESLREAILHELTEAGSERPEEWEIVDADGFEPISSSSVAGWDLPRLAAMAEGADDSGAPWEAVCYVVANVLGDQYDLSADDVSRAMGEHYRGEADTLADYVRDNMADVVGVVNDRIVPHVDWEAVADDLGLTIEDGHVYDNV